MNTALQLLTDKLHSSVDLTTRLTTAGSSLDKHLAALRQYISAGSSPYEPEDLQAKAVTQSGFGRSASTIFDDLSCK